MGREIRMVPANWEHPKTMEFNYRTGRQEESYTPLYDRSYREAAERWRSDYAAWEGGERAAYFAEHGQDMDFWEYGDNPPVREEYRPDWKPEEMTWFQVYETVSEGTPVTPPFATKAELVDYLATHGDFWDQRRGDGPWNRANAERFVENGFAPSLIVNASTGVFATPKDGFPDDQEKQS